MEGPITVCALTINGGKLKNICTQCFDFPTLMKNITHIIARTADTGTKCEVCGYEQPKHKIEHLSETSELKLTGDFLNPVTIVEKPLTKEAGKDDD